MLCVGIESTAHTFGVGTFDGSSLTQSKSSYSPKEGGIHPREAAEHHTKVASQVVGRVLKERPTVVAYAKGPGIGPCLRVGAVVARTIASRYGVPLVPVNHCVAHIEVARHLTGARDPVVLYVSGGNTQVIAFSEGKYRIFGETLDIAIGNALDSFARSAGIPFPGGPEIARLADEGGNLIELPYTVKGMDVSFSGLVTKCQRLLKKHPLEDVSYSLQEYAYAALVEITERAMAHTQKQEVLVTGGVAASARLREMVQTMAKERGAEAFTVPREFAGDNGGMIAYTGSLVKEKVLPENARVKQKWRTDEVEINWR